MASILRQAASKARVSSFTSTRTFTTSQLARKDMVQDLYLRELKAYKPALAAKDAHVGVVKTYNAPATPQPPALPVDLASELAAYEATEPSLAEAPKATSGDVDGSSGGADAFLHFLEQDHPKADAHH